MRTPRIGALFLLASFLAPAAAAQVELVRSQESEQLRFEHGTTFHSSAAPIQALQSFRLPGTEVIVATWAEGRTPYYAISLDGTRMATVQATSYELMFRRATFDPLEGEPQYENTPWQGGGNVHVVQYVTQPLLEYSSTITALGGEVFDFIERHAHIVRMTPEVRDQVAALPFVRAIVEYHPELRVDPLVLEELHGKRLAPARYNVQVFLRGLEEQQLVAERIASLGGEIHLLVPEGYRFEASMTAEALIAVASMDQVRFIDPWGAPEDDMDIVRQVGGAVYLENSTGFAGQGVNVEVLDGGTDVNHPDLANHVNHGTIPAGSHGTCTSGIVTGSGAGSALHKGMMPQARLVAGNYGAFVGGNRYAHTAELVNPALTYQCVLQSNSWGSNLTTSYNSTSAEMDDIIAINDFLICQSQSNANSTQSRPQAWAKNIVSVGGINHENTASYADDNWGGASIGPAEDGRIKPDLAYFYDSVRCTDWQGSSGYASGNYYESFSGTSAATPMTAGHFGLFFQMWHAGSFGNTPGAGTVFAARPHFTLAKAAMINTAKQWTFSGANHNLTRTHQGWGHADLASLYDRRQKTFFVNQTDPVSNLGNVTYNLNVAAGEPDLRITLVYRDAMGAVSSGQHRKNDLTLVVTNPVGTVYYGNNGLLAGMWSTSGGTANTKDTVENVLIQNPVAGTYVVQVRGDNVNTDPVTNTPSTVTDFALWATGVTAGPVCPSPIPYCTAKLTSGFTMPAIGYQGVPSVATNNFEVKLSNALPLKSAIVFYGTSQHAGNFHNGVLCAHPPVIRSPVQQTDASSNATYPISVLPAMVGTTRYYQWWFRDPQDTFGDGLSDALEVTFCD
jgi:serine protease AprX